MAERASAFDAVGSVVIYSQIATAKVTKTVTSRQTGAVEPAVNPYESLRFYQQAKSTAGETPALTRVTSLFTGNLGSCPKVGTAPAR